MKKYLVAVLVLIVANLTNTIFAGDAEIGKAAPDFTLTGSNGESYTLSDFKDNIVVLEWINYGCPFVKKHYNSGNMQMLQKKYTEKEVIWLTICSSAEGKQGNFDAETINEMSEEYGAAFTAYLIDDDGIVGKMYDAKTTPHMFVVNKGSILEYAGGIDDIKSTDTADIENAVNYVDKALTELLNNSEVVTKVSVPYGCSVKYK